VSRFASGGVVVVPVVVGPNMQPVHGPVPKPAVPDTVIPDRVKRPVTKKSKEKHDG